MRSGHAERACGAGEHGSGGAGECACVRSTITPPSAVHHFSDVNAGTFIGLACGTAAYHLHDPHRTALHSSVGTEDVGDAEACVAMQVTAAAGHSNEDLDTKREEARVN